MSCGRADSLRFSFGAAYFFERDPVIYLLLFFYVTSDLEDSFQKIDFKLQRHSSDYLFSESPQLFILIPCTVQPLIKNQLLENICPNLENLSAKTRL